MRDTECQTITSTGYAESAPGSCSNPAQRVDDEWQPGGGKSMCTALKRQRRRLTCGANIRAHSRVSAADGVVNEEPVESHVALLQHAASGSLTSGNCVSIRKELAGRRSRPLTSTAPERAEQLGCEPRGGGRTATQSSFDRRQKPHAGSNDDVTNRQPEMIDVRRGPQLAPTRKRCEISG